MKIELTLDQLEIIFELVRRACPDEPNSSEYAQKLYALDDFLEKELGYAPN